MSIAVNIISAVIKSIVGEQVGNDLANEVIGISVDGLFEKGMDKVGNFIDDEKAKVEHILSKGNLKAMNIPEENIDYVVAEIKDLLSEVEITDEVLRQCRYDSKKLGIFLWDKYCEYNGNGYIECKDSIKKCLFVVAEALINIMCKSEEFEKDFLIQISNSVDNTNMEMQKLSNYIKENFDKFDANSQVAINMLQRALEHIQDSNIQNKETQKIIKSRTQEYLDKWNKNMFLNDFDKRDEEAGINVKLREIYLEGHLPHYIWKHNKKEHTDLKELLTEYINAEKDNKMLLILGQPGIGKSTLITWLAIHFIHKVDNILVYQFADDLKNVEWENMLEDYALNKITRELGLEDINLSGKILILDGFDEISIKSDRMKAINWLYRELVVKSGVKGFSLIITCRENYISKLDEVSCDYITLQPLDERQIQSFCGIYQIKAGRVMSQDSVTNIIKNKSILGIPLILYMILALDISVGKESSIVEVYDRIFSLKVGGIYERCINKIMFADYHRISEIKEQIHQISREIAIWMFENNPSKAYIPKEEYQKICTSIMRKYGQKDEDIKKDFLIGNYFKLVKHCSGIEKQKLYFVHRSIYEYFVSETIYNSIEKAIVESSENSQKNLAKNIAFYLKSGEITYTIGEYLKHKILKLYSEMQWNTERRKKVYQWWEDALDKMMEVGMFYYTEKNIINYENVIRKEVNCFLNFLTILRLLLETSEKKYMLEKADKKYLIRYIKYSVDENALIGSHEKIVGTRNIDLSCISLSDTHQSDYESILTGINLVFVDLSGANLSKMHLSNGNLKGSNLRYADLTRANLRRTYLEKADLKYANLTGADLRETNLRGADLRRTNLRGADLRDADLKGANLKGTDLNGAIFDETQASSLGMKYNLNSTYIYDNDDMKILSYKEYCFKKVF